MDSVVGVDGFEGGSPTACSPALARGIRILFIVEAVSLAHVARARVLAAMLDDAGFSITMACDDRYDFLFEPPKFARLPLESISSEDFGMALQRGTPIYSLQRLQRYAVDDRRVMDRVEPDVVIGDFRLSLSVSARIAKIPYATVTNAGWSPYASVDFPVPDTLLTRTLGVTAAQWSFDRLRPVVFALHASALNRLRRRHGLAPLPADLRYTYTDADCVLYADLPEVIATPGAPPSHRHLGPLLWSPAIAEPEWSGRVPGDRPLIYVTLGSSGRSSLFPEVVKALAGLPVVVVAATAGHAGAAVPTSGNRFCADFLAGEAWARRARVVVCNGGSPTCYQALAEGVPVVGLPGNLDQFLNMAAVERTGAGRLVRATSRTAQDVCDAVREMLDEPRYAHAAGRLATLIRDSDPARVASETLVGLSRAGAGS